MLASMYIIKLRRIRCEKHVESMRNMEVIYYNIGKPEGKRPNGRSRL
jgi:hypothetical protein